MSESVTLKTKFRNLLNETLKASGKKPKDIVKGSTHGHNYVSEIRKNDTNHCLDSCEGIFNAINYELDFVATPKEKISENETKN